LRPLPGLRWRDVVGAMPGLCGPSGLPGRLDERVRDRILAESVATLWPFRPAPRG